MSKGERRIKKSEKEKRRDRKSERKKGSKTTRYRYKIKESL